MINLYIGRGKKEGERCTAIAIARPGAVVAILPTGLQSEMKNIRREAL